MTIKIKNWDALKSKPVAIFGHGVSGHGVASLLDQFHWDYQFFDQKEQPFNAENALSYAIVVVSPGFGSDHPWVLSAQKAGLAIYGELDFASTFTKNKIVAVTGTNGKTSLVTLLSHIWNKLGKPAVCGGNVGTSLSEVVTRGLRADTTVFLEVSSFQAENIKFLSPDTVIWTNFSPDHLDHHPTIKDYFKAKNSLLKGLKDGGSAICGLSVLDFARLHHLSLHRSVKGVSRNLIDAHRLEPGSFLSTYPQQENLALAYTFSLNCGVTEEEFFASIRSYQPEPSRLACIAEIDGVSFWNDSKATNFASTIAASKNFRRPFYWIGGGKEKGESLPHLIKGIKKSVAHAFVIGEVATKLSELLRRDGIAVTCCSSLIEAVKKAYNHAKHTTDILFSPGFASFDMFENYIERGNIFNQVVLDLKKRHTPCTQ